MLEIVLTLLFNWIGAIHNDSVITHNKCQMQHIINLMISIVCTTYKPNGKSSYYYFAVQKMLKWITWNFISNHFSIIRKRFRRVWFITLEIVSICSSAANEQTSMTSGETLHFLFSICFFFVFSFFIGDSRMWISLRQFSLTKRCLHTKWSGKAIHVMLSIHT